MPDLPVRPDLEQLRRQAKDLLRAAKSGDPDAYERIGAVSDRLILSSAQLAVAHEYGFTSWVKLKREVERRAVLNSRDLSRLQRLLAEEPELASAKLEHWCDHPRGAEPLGYIAMLRFDSRRLGLPRDPAGTGAVAKALLDAGAPVDGTAGDPETPLITAASYGDAEVARVLVEAGADLEATAAQDAGGVPGGTALLHAAVFGMTGVIDVLVQAGARVHSLEEAAAAGDISGWLTPETPIEPRIRALVMAADHERLNATWVASRWSTRTARPRRPFRRGRQPAPCSRRTGRRPPLCSSTARPRATSGNDEKPGPPTRSTWDEVEPRYRAATHQKIETGGGFKGSKKGAREQQGPLNSDQLRRRFVRI